MRVLQPKTLRHPLHSALKSEQKIVWIQKLLSCFHSVAFHTTLLPTRTTHLKPIVLRVVTSLLWSPGLS